VVLRHRPAMLAVFVAVLLATIRMFNVVPKGFVPEQDNDSLGVNIRAAQGTSYYEMTNYALKAADIVNQNPYVEAIMVGGGGPGGPGGSFARLDTQLVPRRQRPFTAQQIAQQIRPQLLRFPGFRAFVSLPPALQIGGRMGNSSYQVTVQSLN